MGISRAVERIRQWAAKEGHRPARLAVLAGLNINTLRSFNTEGWNPRLKTLEALDCLIPPTYRWRPEHKMAPRTETLATYLEATETTPTAFARLLKVAHSTVLRYLDGSRIPRPEMMGKIRSLTSGRVSAESFYAVPPKRKWA